MGKLMGQHPSKFGLAENVQNAFRNSDGSMFLISACGKGVRTLLRNHVDFRHGHMSAQRQVLNDAMELRGLLQANFFRPVHAENNLVTEPVTDPAHDQSKEKSRHHAAFSS